MINAVIFDMDGVLIDSEHLYHQVNKDIFKKMNWEITDEEYNDFIGGDDSRLWAYVKNKHNIDKSVDELLDLELQEDLKFFRECDEKAMPGVIKILDTLKANNIKIGLASSSLTELVHTILENLNIKQYFEQIICGDNVEHGKPSPDIFLLAAKKLGVNSENCLVFEDSANGVKAATSAGMKCIGLVNENSGKQDLSKSDKIFNSLEEVNLEIIKNI